MDYRSAMERGGSHSWEVTAQLGVEAQLWMMAQLGVMAQLEGDSCCREVMA